MHSTDPSFERDSFLSEVEIHDYKSIGAASVRLGLLTVLVGRNGSGKSNFLDALRFVSDSLETSIDHAVRSRGVLGGISRRGSGYPQFSLRLNLDLPEDRSADYYLNIDIQPNGEFEISSEVLDFSGPGANISYVVYDGKVHGSSIDRPPAAQPDRLYLGSISGFPEFRSVYDAIAGMKFYDFNTEVMKKPQSPDVGGWLRSDGSNIASVVARLSTEQPEVMSRIAQYLAAIVPGILAIERVSLGPVETLKFIQQSGDASKPHEFFAWNMSDGTLRALGSLIAVNQLAGRGESASLIGIEEPETSLHPAATAALMDGLREATEHTQVIITSHSPDLLDQMDLDTDKLLAVALQNGVTRIAPIDKPSRSAIRDHLYTPGELLRLDQLEPDQDDLAKQESSAKGKEEA
jgi:predicted ATPase